MVCHNVWQPNLACCVFLAEYSLFAWNKNDIQQQNKSKFVESLHFFTDMAHTLSATAHSGSGVAIMWRFEFDMHSSIAAHTLHPEGLGTNE